MDTNLLRLSLKNSYIAHKLTAQQYIDGRILEDTSDKDGMFKSVANANLHRITQNLSSRLTTRLRRTHGSSLIVEDSLYAFSVGEFSDMIDAVFDEAYNAGQVDLCAMLERSAKNEGENPHAIE